MRIHQESTCSCGNSCGNVILIGALGRERPGKSLAAWFKASENGHASHEAEWQVQLRLNFPGFPLI